MQYVPPKNGAANASYTDFNPQTGEAGSIPLAASIEHPMREIVNAIVAAGITPDGNDLNQLTQAIRLLAEDQTPVGSVFYIASATVPDNYLECNGAVVSRTTYADLFNSIGTTYNLGGESSTQFRIPDLRGEFIRGWDHGRGIDSNRGFGTAQADELKRHYHLLARNIHVGYTNLTSSNTIANRGYNSGHSGGFNDENYKLIGTSGDANVGRSSSEGGSEIRPRNIALMAIIKY